MLGLGLPLTHAARQRRSNTIPRTAFPHSAELETVRSRSQRPLPTDLRTVDRVMIHVGLSPTVGPFERGPEVTDGSRDGRGSLYGFREAGCHGFESYKAMHFANKRVNCEEAPKPQVRPQSCLLAHRNGDTRSARRVQPEGVGVCDSEMENGYICLSVLISSLTLFSFGDVLCFFNCHPCIYSFTCIIPLTTFSCLH